jgi:6-phosphogluconolactonase
MSQRPDQQQIRRLHLYADATEIVADLSSMIATVAQHCIDTKGAFRCVLAGGETPRRLYQQLREISTPWRHWHIYFGDERCLPVGDPARNDRMAASAWLEHVAIPRTQIHSIAAEQGPEAGARDYANTLAAVGHFDLVLLGIGEDGHTASLFPYMQTSLQDDPITTAIYAAPKPPLQRISLSARRLSAADRVWFLVSGEGKRAALASWLSNTALPVQEIRPAAGVDIYTDINNLIETRLN